MTVAIENTTKYIVGSLNTPSINTVEALNTRFAGLMDQFRKTLKETPIKQLKPWSESLKSEKNTLKVRLQAYRMVKSGSWMKSAKFAEVEKYLVSRGFPVLKTVQVRSVFNDKLQIHEDVEFVKLTNNLKDSWVSGGKVTYAIDFILDFENEPEFEAELQRVKAEFKAGNNKATVSEPIRLKYLSKLEFSDKNATIAGDSIKANLDLVSETTKVEIGWIDVKLAEIGRATAQSKIDDCKQKFTELTLEEAKVMGTRKKASINAIAQKYLLQ